jgi:hypothetical protein
MYRQIFHKIYPSTIFLVAKSDGCANMTVIKKGLGEIA